MAGRSLSKFAWMEALRGADLTHAEYRVLLNLSTYARGDLTNAHPGFARICKDACVSEPTAKKALRSLVAKGWLVLTDRGGNEYWHGKANVYALTIPKEVSHLPPSGDDKEVTHLPPYAGDKGANQDPEGGNSVSEGGRSTPTEGGNSLIPQQGTPTGHLTSEQSGGVVALGNARASERGDENPKPPRIVSVQTDSNPGERMDSTTAVQPVTATEQRRERVVADEPTVDPTMNPLAWIDNELPGGFRIGERAEAKRRLDEGENYATIRWDLVRDRNANKRSRRIRRRFVDDSEHIQETPA